MKKNILSLVAFMAFSVSAFANTVEVKEEVVVEDEVVVVVDCFQFAQAAEQMMTEITGCCGYHWFQDAYDWCVEDGDCHNCLNEVVIIQK